MSIKNLSKWCGIGLSGWIFIFACSLPAGADQDPGNASTILLYIENDILGGTDEYYTAAFKLTWVSKDLGDAGNGMPGWSMWLSDRMHSDGRRDDIHNITVSLGQDIYTPEDTRAEELIADDRPYAGWTYLSLGLHRAHPDRMTSLELTLGIVGPSSLAEKGQEIIHDWIDDKQPRGWDNQLEDELGLMLSWQRYWRSDRKALGRGCASDLIPHAGFTLGNVYTYANAGFEARIGHNLPVDFGTSLIRPGGGTAAPVGVCDPRLNSGSFGWSFFGGADGRAVARNIFLDGNTFEDSHSVEKEYFVADVYVGFSIVYRRFKFTYTHTYRTEEFEEQDGGQYFGSFSFAWTF